MDTVLLLKSFVYLKTLKMNKYTVGIVGSSGAVGKEIINVLYIVKYPIKELKLFATQQSAGKVQNTQFGDIVIEEYTLEACKVCEIIFLAVSGDFSFKNSKLLAANGSIVIDNSSSFRYDKETPLIIPQINGNIYNGESIIANPNCTTAIAIMALGPIHKKFKIKRAFFLVKFR